jgi:hypothetical protein
VAATTPNKLRSPAELKVKVETKVRKMQQEALEAAVEAASETGKTRTRYEVCGWVHTPPGL